jgi:putative ATP-dependent endonuclease of the OLD family
LAQTPILLVRKSERLGLAMHIAKVCVRNFRCLSSFELDLASYTALIGPNGVGKSSVLYALQWFFGDLVIGADDLHRPNFEEALVDSVEVLVTFEGLSERDRVRLKEYGRGTRATFRRTWTRGGPDKGKVVGNALQGPGFASLRAMTKVGEFRTAYTTMRASLPALPDLGMSPSKAEVDNALVQWEADPTHVSELVEVENSDADHMFGFNGPSVIKECVRMVLVPASSEMAAEVGGMRKGTALDLLIGALTSAAGAEAQAAWVIKHQADINQLSDSIVRGMADQTRLQAERVNDRLGQLVPNATVTFHAVVPDWQPKLSPSISTGVTVNGTTNDISRQGHGVQRAVMMAMLQSLVPDQKLLDHTFSSSDESIQAAEERAEKLSELIADLPSLLVCIEEPEIYQHPVRARAFARVLSDLADGKTAQVLLATHSPYFVRPAQFESLRRLQVNESSVSVAATTLDLVGKQCGADKDKVEKFVQKNLPYTFSEGFFAERVILVEGDTDAAVLEVCVEKLGYSLDSYGIVVLASESKDGMKIPFGLLRELQVQTFVVFDGDALGAERKHPEDSIQQAKARSSHEASTKKILHWLPKSTCVVTGSSYSFGKGSTVTHNYAAWEDDLEAELAKWRSFMQALALNEGELRSKQVHTYRAAAIDAELGDMPTVLRLCAETVLGLTSLPLQRDDST